MMLPSLRYYIFAVTTTTDNNDHNLYRIDDSFEPSFFDLQTLPTPAKNMASLEREAQLVQGRIPMNYRPFSTSGEHLELLPITVSTQPRSKKPHSPAQIL